MEVLTLGLVGVLAGILTVEPGAACPSPAGVSAELERLGALTALAEMGTAEVHVRGPALQIVLRDQQGQFLGAREVTVPADCAARATLAAVMIAAWAGDWRETRVGSPAPPLPPSAAVHARPEPAPPVSSSAESWGVALGISAFGVHDGDQPAGGAGASLEVVRAHLLLTAMIEATTERDRPLGPGLAAYSSLDGGFGVGGATRWNRLFVDGTLAPLLSRRSLEGKNLQTTHRITSWGVSLKARARLGWTGKLVTPHLFLAISRDSPRQEGILDDRPDVLTLSSTNVAVGLGLLFHLRP